MLHHRSVIAKEIRRFLYDGHGLWEWRSIVCGKWHSGKCKVHYREGQVTPRGLAWK